jgi:hypothetical protein
MSPRSLHHIGCLLGLSILLLVGASTPVQAQLGQRCFPETGFCMAGRIRAFWEQNGGLPVFGFPIGAQHEELIEGKPFQVQWFERNRLELHPENQPPYDVLLGRLGVDRLQQQGRDPSTFPKADPQAPHYFTQIGHAIAPQFWGYWSSHGLEFDGRRGTSFAESLALFGTPLSEPAMETNSDGAAVLTQWFERARFELHPENQPPYDVLLGLLGDELHGREAPVPQPTPTGGHTITTVFLIVMENHNWSSIQGSEAAPYINETLLPQASYAQQYYNPPGIHPSEPNYLWLEAGTNFGITNDADPESNHQSTPNHLVSLLTQAGISWKAYQEDIDGATCPLTRVARYAPKHNPTVFFDDVTNANNPQSANCIAHERPYSELATDLQNSTVARYNFITPNLCNDMHDCSIGTGDTWLAREIPKILNAQAYKNGGAIFITWDEGEGGDGPIGMIVLAPNAKGGGYSNTIHYTHSSTLRTIQEIFGVTPLLGDAANATDLSDLFRVFP